MSTRSYYFDADKTAIDPYFSYSTYYTFEKKPEPFAYCLNGCITPKISLLLIQDGQLICKDRNCNISKNPVAKQLYSTANSVYRFFSSEFNLCGIDGKGNFPQIFIGWDEHNASWICQNSFLESEQCAFLFHDDYALQSEVVAHEYVHGIVKSLRSLDHSGQAGALNESLADVFAIAFKHWKDRNTQSDWTIVERDLSKKITMRSFNNKKDVHDNSLIPSHAFYRAVESVGVNSWGIVAKIWFLAFQNLSLPNATFKEFAQATINQAQEYEEFIKKSKGIDLKLVQKITQSWKEVGINFNSSNVSNRRKNYSLTR